jgi:hypothetical protein
VGGRGKAIAGLALGCLGLLVVPALVVGYQRVQESALKCRDKSHLKQMALAFHRHNDTYGYCPAATAYRTKDGKPGLSWRVAILPFIEEEALFQQFKLDEPWDSPHNIKLLGKMPRIYELPGKEDEGSGLTYDQVFVGPGAVFESRGRPRAWQPNPLAEEGPRIPARFYRGTSSTILIATAATPVPWTKPDDLAFDRDKPLPPLGGHYRGGFHVALADGSVRWMDGKMPLSAFKDAIMSEPPPLSSEW